MNRFRPARFRVAAAITGVLAIVLASPGHGQFIETPEQKVIPSLVVTGEADLHKPADQLNLSFAVVTENTDAAKALDENSKRMEKVLGALGQLGLDESEYETGRFEIRPQYSRRPRQADPEWRPEITGYEVTNSVLVKTKKLDSAGSLISAATGAGANSVNRIQFALSDERQYRSEVITQATAHALEDARVLADAAGLSLVRVLSISIDSAGPEGVGHTFARGRIAAVADSPAAPPINPGDITVKASVTLKYEVAGADKD